MSASYRARRPRASPWWQCLHACLGDFLANYPTRYEEASGPLRSVVSPSLRAFLRCGDLAQGFARIRCADCAHEYLLPFTCKKRGACPSCHQRRSVDAAHIIAREICAPAPHRQIVLTVPRALRWPFRRKREHLALLFAAAHESLLIWFRERTGQPSGQIAAIAGLHTFGDYLVFHPHLHILAANGVFDQTGAFHLAPSGGAADLAELFRHAILCRFVDTGIIEAWQAHRFLSWRHSGFQVDVGEAPLAADDAAGRQRLAEYLLRAPLALDKMHWNPATRTVLYRSARSWHTKRNYEIFAGADFIAALAEHIPEKSNQLIRYYGRYSNKCRGLARKTPFAPPYLTQASDPSAGAGSREAGSDPESRLRDEGRRRTWRALVIRVWGADPLRCPCCGGLMRNVGLIKKPAAIRDWLTRLGLWEGISALPPAHAPPLPIKTILWGVDTWDARIVEFEPGMELVGLPDRRLNKAPRERSVSYSSADCEKVGVESPAAEESQEQSWQPLALPRSDGLFLVYDGGLMGACFPSPLTPTSRPRQPQKSDFLSVFFFLRWLIKFHSVILFAIS